MVTPFLATESVLFAGQPPGLYGSVNVRADGSIRQPSGLRQLLLRRIATATNIIHEAGNGQQDMPSRGRQA